MEEKLNIVIMNLNLKNWKTKSLYFWRQLLRLNSDKQHKNKQ